ncbi:MAG: hypothetical protein J5861_07960 [Desulfovibrio sp.]|nr:hypothetical protein [Desulfovibrio sp.]
MPCLIPHCHNARSRLFAYIALREVLLMKTHNAVFVASGKASPRLEEVAHLRHGKRTPGAQRAFCRYQITGCQSLGDSEW